MPQDFNVDATGNSIDTGRLTALRAKAKENGEVFPFDVTKVYATQQAVDAKYLPEIKTVGQELKDVHVNVADKLNEKGLFTKEKPKTDKADKSTKDK